MILLVSILSLALLGTLGCVSTLVYVIQKERKTTGVIIDVEELKKMYLQVSTRAIEEAAMNSLEAYVQQSRTEANTERSSPRRQSYPQAVAEVA